MKSVLISIQPKWVEKIANGEKTIEVRKTAPKCEVPFKCYIYETKGETETPWVDEDGHFIYKGRGQVVGEFVCDRVYKWECKNRLEILESFPIWRASYMLFVDDLEKTCLTYDDLWDYGNGKPLYGLHISDLKIYDKPKELGEFYTPCPTKEKGDCLSCDCLADNDYGGVCTNNLTRAPQSWQYVEE
jgi:predicted transcriptional regulator